MRGSPVSRYSVLMRTMDRAQCDGRTNYEAPLRSTLKEFEASAHPSHGAMP